MHRPKYFLIFHPMNTGSVANLATMRLHNAQEVSYINIIFIISILS